MKDILTFLSELRQNNNKEWFDVNRVRYKAVQEKFNDFITQLIARIALFDPNVANVTTKDSVFRIYRDVRFSPNKEPYKSHIGAYICKGGKKSGYAGYYFHIEPGASILAVGLHCPDPKVVRSVRDEIFDNGDVFQKMIDNASEAGFKIDLSPSLQKVPKDYPADFKYGNYLKLKEFDLIKSIDLTTVTKNELLDRVADEFLQAKEFNDMLNRAVQFAFEEM